MSFARYQEIGKHFFIDNKNLQVSYNIRKAPKLNGVLLHNIKKEILGEKYNLNIYFVGEKKIRIVNKKYRNKDYITDIFKKIKVEPDQTIFISSDCLLTFKIASEFFDKFEYNEGEIVHTANEITDDGVYKVLLDLLTLCNCTSTLYLGWNSNFSRIAALYDVNRKFVCYEYQNDPGVIKEISPQILFEYHSVGKYT
jgi:hypothetical protein